jgi:hypothetical protein
LAGGVLAAGCDGVVGALVVSVAAARPAVAASGSAAPGVVAANVSVGVGVGVDVVGEEAVDVGAVLGAASVGVVEGAGLPGIASVV